MSDLREAMDITETSAAQTIQNLEIHASSLEQKLSAIKHIMTDTTTSDSDKVENALATLQTYK